MSEPTTMCYICNRFVDIKKHKCEQAKKLIKNTREMKAPHIHSDALPTITKGFVA